MNGVEVTSVGGFELESSMTSAAGQWTLCYCAARRNGCDDREDFVLDFGTLHILGPLRQDLTCFAGPLLSKSGSCVFLENASLAGKDNETEVRRGNSEI